MQPRCRAAPASPPPTPKNQQLLNMNHVLYLAPLQRLMIYHKQIIYLGPLSLNNFEDQVRLQRRLREMNP